jgi:hypothetical protein
LGLAGYYHKFIRNFGIMAKPLIDLLKKDQLFVWTPSHAEAFQLLKDALYSAPVLALSDFSQPFHLDKMLQAPVLALSFIKIDTLLPSLVSLLAHRIRDSQCMKRSI